MRGSAPLFPERAPDLTRAERIPYSLLRFFPDNGAMLEIDIPGYRTLKLAHLVLDMNGTVACDGKILRGVAERIEALAALLSIHVLTADTFGGAADEFRGLPCRVKIVAQNDQTEAKRDYVFQLGSEESVCIGNGRNDTLMLQDAALGIAVVQQECAAAEALAAADLVAPGITHALDLLLHTKRLMATLRA